jgi:hypothetical protein
MNDPISAGSAAEQLMQAVADQLTAPPPVEVVRAAEELRRYTGEAASLRETVERASVAATLAATDLTPGLAELAEGLGGVAKAHRSPAEAVVADLDRLSGVGRESDALRHALDHLDILRRR